MIEVGKESTKMTKLDTIWLENESSKKYIHSKYDPIKEGKAWAKENKNDTMTTYLIYGGGMLYHVVELLEEMSDNSSIIVVEPEKRIYEFVKNSRSFKKLEESKKFSYFFYDDPSDFSGMLVNFLKTLNADNLKMLITSPYQEYYPDMLKSFIKGIKEFILLREIDENTTERFVDVHLENVFSNLFEVSKSNFAMDFYQKFKGRPAIVVSAGPSLDKNVELLKGNEDKVIIISGGRTLKTLLDRGIKPHFVVSIDPSDRNFKLIEEVLDSDVPMLNTLLTNKNIPRKYQGPVIFFDNSDIDKIDTYFFDKKIDTISVSGTVATVQLNFARYLGCSKIAFIGQDLAFTGDRMHSESTSLLSDDEDKREGFVQKKIEVGIIAKGSIEDEVRTSELFYGYKIMIDKYVSELGENVQAFDCTEGGILLEGTKIIPLKEFLEKECTENIDYYTDIKKIIDENKNKYSEEDIVDKLHQLENKAFKIVKITSQGLDIISKNISLDSSTEKDEKKLKKINNKILSLVSDVEFAPVVIDKIFKMFERADVENISKEEELAQNVRKIRRAYYAAVKGLYMVVDKYIKDAIKEQRQLKEEKKIEKTE